MPRKIFGIKLFCPRCEPVRCELTSCGVYKVIRQVLHLDSCYYMASEYLECTKKKKSGCGSKYISWSEEILKQLDPGHRTMFPALLTHQYSCDLRLVRMMRNRGVGNSATKLRSQVQECHTEVWLDRCVQRVDYRLFSIAFNELDLCLFLYQCLFPGKVIVVYCHLFQVCLEVFPAVPAFLHIFKCFFPQDSVGLCPVEKSKGKGLLTVVASKGRCARAEIIRNHPCPVRSASFPPTWQT